MAATFIARTAYNLEVDTYRDSVENTWTLPAKSRDIGHLYWFEDELLFHLETDHPSDTFAKIFRLSPNVRVAIVGNRAWTLRETGTKLVVEWALGAYNHPLGLIVVGKMALVLVTVDSVYDLEDFAEEDLDAISIVDGAILGASDKAVMLKLPPISLEGYVGAHWQGDQDEKRGIGKKFKSAISRIFRR